MTNSHQLTRKALLLAAATPLAIALSAPAFAQDVPSATQNAEDQSRGNPATQEQTVSGAQNDTPGGQDVVVTGSILRQTDAATPSPVTTLTAENLDQRGINTVQSAIQQLASNNGPALTNSFTANGAFASGASAVSLRGLSTNSTLVLFDGLRAAYYPLSDDGTRNFVDLNTIPDDIVERIEVLRDGASSSYGADAIAGVVNIITKKNFQGVGGRAEAGISERGTHANQRLSLTAGTGDLDEKGFNAYASGFYYHENAVANRDVPYPYNSADQRGIGGPNDTAGGADASGNIPGTAGFTVGSNIFVRPGNASTFVGNGRYQLLQNQCLNGTPYSPTAAELAGASNTSLPTTLCRQDLVNQYGTISPNITRFGGSARITAKVGDTSEAYLEANFQQSTVDYYGAQTTIRATAPTGILFPQFSTSSTAAIYAPGSAPLSLPVYICPERTNCATSPNRQLNPQNPFAATGQVGLLAGFLPDSREFNETRSRVYRVAAGIRGTVFGSWDYSVNATAMHNDLRQRADGYVYIQNLLNVLADGTYNFRNPAANSQAIRNYIMPENIVNDSSDEDELQFTLSKQLFELPGGPVQLGLGGELRYEAIDAPSANNDINGPTQRYYRINAFGTNGHRYVESGFFEINAPIFDQFSVNGSGRFDNYSSGQNYFSPKVGAKFTPIRQLALRGTWSKGFRIPSFAEANALPTTGYVTNSVGLFNDAYLAQYGCTVKTFTSCPAYIRSGSFGQTTLASPNLDPEKSRSFTAGAVIEPIRNVSLTVDFFDIKKSGAITTPSSNPALTAYYSGQAIPAGYTVIPDAPDINNPTATPRVGFVQANLINANTIHSQGIDIGGTASLHITPDVKFTLSGEGEVILDLSTTFPDGHREKYNGTLGNFSLTAGSGTPEWHANLTGTIEVRQFTLSATANYFDGYDLSAQDNGDDYKDCGSNPGYVSCRVPSYTTVDLVGTIKASDKFSFYVDVLNLLNDYPPIDPVTYGANLYNPVQGGTGIYGRQFRAGVKVGF